MTTDPAARSVAHHLIDGLRRVGIDQLFCLPGVQNDDFFDVLFDAPDITPIVARHEQGASYMAMGAAAATGRPAAMCVVPGPGMLNAAAGLTSACGAGARVLALVGQIPTPALGRGYRLLHELDDQPAVLAQVTKHVAALRRPEQAVGQIQGAFDALVSGTPRPVAIEVPANLWGAAAPGGLTDPAVTMPVVSESALEQAVAAIRASRNPLIWVGTGAQDASAAVRRFADLLQAPVSTRRMGHGVMDADDPLSIPMGVAHDLWAGVDLVIGIGSRIEFPLLQWGRGDLRLIQINTDWDELDRHNIGAIGLHGDATAVVAQLIGALAAEQRPDRRPEFAALKAEFRARIAHLEPQIGFLQAIESVLPADGIIVEDVTQVTFAAHFAYPFRRPRTLLSTGFAGTLGSAVATAIGTKAALPDRAVVAISGDGGFLFSATELASAVQHHIGAVTIVFDDGAYGNVRRIQQERYGPTRTIASSLVNPDFVAFARSFGAHGVRAESPGELGVALAAAVTKDLPTVIHVPVGPMPTPWPFILMPKVR